MSNYIKRRDDVNPDQGERDYGNVQFADSTNNKYPIDTPEHIRAAWSYINHKDNAAKYKADEVKTIKERIKRAAKKHDIEIEED
jgi:flagellar biosynthesis protein FlhB